MRSFVLFVFAIAVGLPMSALCDPASDQSIEELLVLTKTQAMMDATYALVAQQMRQSIQQAVAGKTLTPAQQQFVDAFPGKFVETMKTDFNWDTVKPTIIQVYRDTYDQAEINGIVAFFKTPAGQAYATKSTQLVQKMNSAMQSRIQQLIPKMQAALRSAVAEAQLQN